MNQMRTLLIFAWLMVAALLWMEWGRERAPKPVQAATTATVQPIGTAVPAASVPAASSAPTAGVPVAPGQAPATAPTATQAAAAVAVTLSNDVLRLTVDGNNVRRAELLNYRVSRKPDAEQVRLFDDNPLHYYVAQAAWTSAQGAPGTAGSFVPETTASDLTLVDGAKDVSARFVWNGGNGVSIRRTYTLARGEYSLKVRDEIVNRGTAAWVGDIQRSLTRVPPVINTSFVSPERFGFNGAAWYTPEEKYQKRTYDKFLDDDRIDPIEKGDNVSGGWIALLQHYFVTGWIPQPDQSANYMLATDTRNYAISAIGPRFTVAPGAQASSEAKLWIGPKLPEKLALQGAGFERVLDYGMLTVLAEPMHWLLTQFHKLTRNWGFAIMLLVLLIKLLLYPLSAAQYKSAAKMRRIQPRLQQLKERYGEDKTKFQTAMLELYKKEKINPASGCLPVLIQMPVFFALYWVLIESVELRQAPWMLWIQDLTARDQFFILPALNMAVMWFTQKLTPMVGVDPIQQRMFQFMPLIFGVMFAFMPAGLVLYWVTNGTLGLIQQLWMIRQFGDKPEAPAKA